MWNGGQRKKLQAFWKWLYLLSLTSMRRMDLFMILKSNLLAVSWQLVTRHFWPRFNISEILSAAVSFCNNFYEHFRWTLCSSGRKWARTFSRMPFLGSGKNHLHIYLRAASWPCIFLLKVRPAILKFTKWEKCCQFLCGKKQSWGQI